MTTKKTKTRLIKTRALSVTRTVILFMLASLIFGCASNKADDHEIISILIDEFVEPIKPPPPFENDPDYNRKMDSIISVIKSEEWINQPKIVALHQDDDFDKSLIDSKKFKFYSSGFNLSMIKATRGNKLIKIKAFDKSIYEDVDFLFLLSPIAYDEFKTKAYVVVGVYTGTLAGFSTLAELEKKEGVWYFVKSKGLHIS